MPLLKDYVREMIAREPDLGRIHTVTGLAAQTCTVAQLATGYRTSNAFKGQFLARRDSANVADRSRIVTSFDSATGIFTHQGAAYVDQTAGTEIAELTEHDTYKIDASVQSAIQRFRHLDSTIIPTRNADRYWLDVLTWLRSPGDVRRIYTRSLPVLSNNRQFDGWHSVHTDGTLRPDNWTLSGTSGVWARAAGVDRSPYMLDGTRSGTNLSVAQSVPLLLTGVASDTLRGQLVTAFLLGRSGQASSMRVRSADGVGTDINSSYHTGNGRTQELLAEQTVDTNATGLTVSGLLEVNETGHFLQMGMIVGKMTDNVRRDTARMLASIPPSALKFETRGGPAELIVNRWGLGSQIVIESWRPYPGFDSARLASGNADADSQDAPLDVIAECALWYLYDGLPKNAANISIAMKHEEMYQSLAGGLLYTDEDQEQGLALPIETPHPPARRA